jgi:mycothiol synthase
MALLHVARHLPDERTTAAVRRLAGAAEVADGYPSVADSRLLAPQADGFVAAVTWDATGSDAVGYVQAVRSVSGWDVEGVVHPDHRSDRTLLVGLLRAVLDALAADGDDVRVWAYAARPDDDRIAAALGLRLHREVRQLRRPLPAEEPWDLVTRPFVVGRDEPAWLEVNNRAFAWHPDQSGWTAADIRTREHEPWFDPDGFLLHERDGRLVGFCWTKVHDATSPPLGEIYVVGVDPGAQGHGLGRALVLAGLDHLARQGLEVGMLYVESTNEPALRLYDRLGFTIHHVDRAYSR